MDMIRNSLSGFLNWHRQHWPYWVVLGVGMVAILIFEARDVGLEFSQWFWLVVITLFVAILCIWIITWGDDEEEGEQSGDLL